MEIYWYLIPQDGPYPWHPKGRRTIDYSYLAQIARAVDHLGYTGALLATGGGEHDAWVLGSSLIPITQRMKFIIAVHPGIVAPLMLAQKAATFDQFSDGRLILNMVTGENRQMPPYGITLDHDERYALTDEYWGVWRRLMTGETVTYDGRYVSLKEAQLKLPALQKPYPKLFFGGSSEPALNVAARHADTYLTWGEPPPQAAEKIKAVRARAKALGRDIKFGIRINLIVRETKEEAWAAAQWLLDRMDDETVALAQGRNTASDSVGQARMRAIVGDRKPKFARDLEVYPDIWAGFGLVRNGPGTAIVGDPETVAARIREYQDIGFDTFIVSGQPLLEETYRVADLLLPLLPFDRSAVEKPQLNLGPYHNAARGRV
ncbi:LLM class flavin-dependent oxidoreductase [Bradyrhizobium sp. 2]|uniref:LLM class flavin-dependent oxidoreductase n=1 Tax=unclassified Bradyrhizobium TaxID=2631580 RepID=UPI001FFC1895|nr:MULTISPECIES: LLM class flavin-dependent oxidoreductase [unclassified Bradyrhizobium]MCK1441714.1 LLM class flavin-dependent oxidoreductase [Bradyrhizobium sp. 48]MCK1465256.1 LLM class flavin-dependent oxidoreductase [Bradyrhizobium sp. 2]